MTRTRLSTLATLIVTRLARLHATQPDVREREWLAILDHLPSDAARVSFALSCIPAALQVMDWRVVYRWVLGMTMRVAGLLTAVHAAGCFASAAVTLSAGQVASAWFFLTLASWDLLCFPLLLRGLETDLASLFEWRYPTVLLRLIVTLLVVSAVGCVVTGEPPERTLGTLTLLMVSAVGTLVLRTRRMIRGRPGEVFSRPD